MAVRAQRPALGISLILLMAAFFAGMDTIIRSLAGQLPVLLLLTALAGVPPAARRLGLGRHGRHHGLRRGQRLAQRARGPSGAAA